jgi:hypothetical protein
MIILINIKNYTSNKQQREEERERKKKREQILVKYFGLIFFLETKHTHTPRKNKLIHREPIFNRCEVK